MILHIDDDDDDRDMLESAFQNIRPEVTVVPARDGRAGVAYLENAKVAQSLPRLVVLDINMPVLDGRKTLELIRADNYFNKLPIVIFTSSSNKVDRDFFASRAAEFIIKSSSLADLNNIARQLLNYCHG